MLMDGFRVFGAVIVDSKKLTVSICKRVVVKIVQRSQSVDHSGLTFGQLVRFALKQIQMVKRVGTQMPQHSGVLSL